MAEVIEGTGEELQIMQVIRAQKINRGGYCLELFVQIPESDLKEMAETIELPNGSKLALLAEMKSPTCFHSGKKNH